MSKAERLNRMQRYAYRRRQFTLRELMVEFGISRSTALRDIQSLEELGLPLFAQHGRFGGYRLLDTASLPPVSFTNGEVLSLYMAMQALRGRSGEAFRVSFASIRAKFLDVVSEEQRRQIERFEHRIAFDPHESAEPGDYLEELLHAAVRGEVLAIRYASPREPQQETMDPGSRTPNQKQAADSDQAIDEPSRTERAEPWIERQNAFSAAGEEPPAPLPPHRHSASDSAIRRIQPFAVYAADGFWYCRAFDLDKNGYRVFRCDRILSAEPSEDEPIAELQSFDLRDAQSLRRPSDDAIAFRCRVQPEAAARLRRRLYPSMTLTEESSGLILSGTYEPPETNFIVTYLAGFGSSLKILEPALLRERLRDHYLRLIDEL
ncbi:helix-turn-helix transcriptional regulator [Saccharibacillus qingshengii]|uniref:helix-turn-helix transcriptional regulator n=1 Tax=Saccharibacillus qingshengii TaxID=1763540 RepID=UPI001553FA24|nr:WYL domain-containing protein [Saccharibacillus qingshengii]